MDETFDVHLSNIAVGTSQALLCERFSQAGSIVKVFVVPPNIGNEFTYGFVRYSDVNSAKNAVALFHNGVKVNGRHIPVSLSKFTEAKIAKLEGTSIAENSSQKKSCSRGRRRKKQSAEANERPLVGERFRRKEGLYQISPDDEKAVMDSLKKSLRSFRSNDTLRRELKIDIEHMLKSFELGVRDVLIQLPSVTRGTGFEPFTVEGDVPCPDRLIDVLAGEEEKDYKRERSAFSVDYRLDTDKENMDNFDMVLLRSLGLLSDSGHLGKAAIASCQDMNSVGCLESTTESDIETNSLSDDSGDDVLNEDVVESEKGPRPLSTAIQWHSEAASLQSMTAHEENDKLTFSLAVIEEQLKRCAKHRSASTSSIESLTGSSESNIAEIHSLSTCNDETGDDQAAVEKASTFEKISLDDPTPHRAKMLFAKASQRSAERLMELDMAFERERLECTSDEARWEVLRRQYERERQMYWQEFLAEEDSYLRT